MSGVKFYGFKATARAIEKLAVKGGEAHVSGMRVIGENIMTDVRASRPGKGVPRDEGVLAASGRVEGPSKEGRVVLSFGGAAAPYALYQHEMVHLRHTVGEARYLVRGVERFQSQGMEAARTALAEMQEAAIKASAVTGAPREDR